MTIHSQFLTYFFVLCHSFEWMFIVVCFLYLHLFFFTKFLKVFVFNFVTRLRAGIHSCLFFVLTFIFFTKFLKVFVLLLVLIYSKKMFVHSLFVNLVVLVFSVCFFVSVWLTFVCWYKSSPIFEFRQEVFFIKLDFYIHKILIINDLLNFNE